MIRWLAIVCLLAAPASAQVFKPKSGSPTTTTTATSSKPKAKKASTSTSRKTSARKASSKKKKAAADEAPKVDPDYVKIIDDDDE